MKLFFLTIFFGFYLAVFSQELSFNESQETFYKRAIDLVDSDKQKALKYLYMVQLKDSENKLGKLAHKKEDSLIPIYRKELINSLKGDYLKTSTGSNWGSRNLGLDSCQQILRIDEYGFSFYRTCNDSGVNELIQHEQFTFFREFDLFPTYDNFIFQDGSVWNFRFKKSKLIAFFQGHENEEGFSQFVCGNTVETYDIIR